MDSTDLSQSIIRKFPVFCSTKILRPDNMKCSFCQKFLSIGPILNNGLESMCGRCFRGNKEFNPHSVWKNQVLYEKIAEYINFPCSNAEFGCDALVNWDEMQKHEESCKYKLKCPFYSEEERVGDQYCCGNFIFADLTELDYHLENFHKELIGDLPEIDFTKVNTKLVLLTRVSMQLVVVVIQCEDSEKFSCLVMLTGSDADTNNFRYQLELYDGRNNSSILRNNRLFSILECQKLLEEKDKKLVIDIKTVKEHFCSFSVILGKLTIVKACTNDVESDKKLDAESTKLRLDQNLLNELECPICSTYMLPPIYICEAGHSFCSSCNIKMKACPFCQASLKYRRNFTLERLTSAVAYPCQYKDFGCPFISSSSDIEAHQSVCQFSGWKCVFGPKCQRAQNMFEHMKSKHADILIRFGSLQLLDLCDIISDTSNKFYGLCHGEDAFRLSVKFQRAQLFFSLHQFDVPSSRFVYELEVINGDKRLIMTTKCLSIDEPLFPDTCVSIPDIMFTKYAAEGGIFSFKVHLRENFNTR